MTTTNGKINREMYELYDSYKESLNISRKALRKRQKLNADIRDTYESPYQMEDYQINKSDITHWNEMIHELEDDMKSIEGYLEFDDRVLLHRDYDNMKSLIYNQNSYEGEIPLETMYSASIPDTTDIICDVELQEEIVELLDKVLTERQREVVEMYFFDGMTMDKIADELGIKKPSVHEFIGESIEKLRKSIHIQGLVANLT